MTARPEPIDDLKRRVNIAEIVGRHVTLKKRDPKSDRWGCCPFHKEKSPSFKANERTQRYHCFGCGADGDVLDFLAEIEGLDTVGAIERLRELVGGTAAPVRPVPPPSGPEQNDRNRELAQGMWRQSEDIGPSTPEPWCYLREARSITVWEPDRLRWHAGERCILAPVNDPVSGHVQAVHRIWPRLRGKVLRLSYGPNGGCASRLFWAPGPQLTIAEGVEDALAAHELAAHELTGLPAWAALSAGNMAALVLPARFTEVQVVADADPAGLDNGAELVRRLRAEGRTARLIKPRHRKDANDVLKARKAAA